MTNFNWTFLRQILSVTVLYQLCISSELYYTLQVIFQDHYPSYEVSFMISLVFIFAFLSIVSSIVRMIKPHLFWLQIIHLVSVIGYFYFIQKYRYFGDSVLFLINLLIFDFLGRFFRLGDKHHQRVVLWSFCLPYFAAGLNKVLNGVIMPFYYGESNIFMINSPAKILASRILETQSKNLISHFLVNHSWITYFGYHTVLIMELTIVYLALKERYRFLCASFVLVFHAASAVTLHVHFEVTFFLVLGLFILRDYSPHQMPKASKTF